MCFIDQYMFEEYSVTYQRLLTVNHEILLTKLHFYGIQGITIDWFGTYLTNRKQKVEIKSRTSTHNLVPEWGILKHGVPPKFHSRTPTIFGAYK